MTYVHFLRPRGGTVTQRTANPCNPVRFRARPPLNRLRLFFLILFHKGISDEGDLLVLSGREQGSFHGTVFYYSRKLLFFIIPVNCCQGKTVYPASVYFIYFVDSAFNDRQWLFLRTWWVNDGFGQQGQNTCMPEELPL